MAVVGAGFAGLSAARMIKRSGLSVRLLEARDRIGGRTYTRYLADGTQIDLGGQWIGPNQHNILRLVRDYGIDTYETPTEGDELVVCGGRRLTSPPAEVTRILQKLDRLSTEIPLSSPWLHPSAKRWDQQTFSSWLAEQSHTRASARYVGRLIAGGLLAGDAGDFSLLEVLFYIASGSGIESLISCDGGAQSYRIAGGTRSVTQAIAAELGNAIRLGRPVHRIEHTERGAKLMTSHGLYKARKVILAIPPTLSGRIDYAPSLPAERDALTQRMPAGYALKIHAVYAKPFWRKAGLSGIAVTDEGVIAETFDDSPPDDGHGVIVAFSYGADARRLRAEPAEVRRELVLEALADFYGADALSPEEFITFDWTAEPWTRGCFSGHLTPGAWTAYGHALRTPVGVLHWAGTETAINWNGYIDGAVESGERAANEVISEMTS